MNREDGKWKGGAARERVNVPHSCSSPPTPQLPKSVYTFNMSSYPYGSGKPSALAEELIKHPIILPALGFTSLLLVGLGIRSGRKRYPTARDIPPRVLRQHRPIRGVCTSVGDGDNFRVWHTPWMARLLRQRPPKGRKGGYSLSGRRVIWPSG
jgi:hypothetical protein